VPAYRAAPAGRTGLPVVLVVHEVFGVHEYIADTARRFAQRRLPGDRAGAVRAPGRSRQLRRAGAPHERVVSQAPDAQVLADLDGALRWAAANGGDTGKAGITGFCWGGRITWLYAATGR
jgi:carboxymethylenebutenolidase